MAAADLAELAFDQSQKRLDKQERVVEELRARTAVLLAASSLAASFPWQSGFRRLGLGCDGRYDLDRFWEQNDLQIVKLRQGVQLAAVGLVVEVLALVALVADTIG